MSTDTARRSRFMSYMPRIVLLSIAVLTLLGQTMPVAYASTAIGVVPAATLDALTARAQQTGTMRLIVGLTIPNAPQGELNFPVSDAVQRQRVAQAQQGLLQRMAGRGVQATAQFEYIPFIGLRANAAAIAALNNDPGVSTIEEDMQYQPMLEASIPLIGGNADGSFGSTNRTGAGQVVAVLDTGVMRTHAFLANKVVSEACYSTTDSTRGTTAFCETGSTAAGSGVNCPASISGCDHGTHVAGIVAGKGTSFNGVAKEASIIAIQVFSRLDNAQCSACTTAYTTDVIKGLERVYALRTTYNIAAVNMSLGGGGPFSSNCDAQMPSSKAAIDNLLNAGIATIIATGNEAFTTGVSQPACISTAVSVGSTTKFDSVSSFSNSGELVDLLAPGSDIQSSVTSSTTAFNNKSGTSMATPHVAGAWAVMRQQNPNASSAQILTALQNTGVAITDSRNNIVRKRISLTAAVNALPSGPNPVPTLGSLSPATVGNGSAAFTLTVNGSNFVDGAVVRWNGAERPTTFVSASQLTATISPADVGAPGTMPVTVVNPTPGGGASGKKDFSVTSSCTNFETNNTLATAKAIQPTQTQLHSFCTEGDEDWIKFTAEMNKRYKITTLALSSVAKVNTVMSLYDATGKVLVAESADVSTDPTSSITFNPTTAGTYFIKLRNRPGLFGAQYTYNVNLASVVVPVITSLTPASREAGYTDFTLVVKGINFDTTSVVRWKGVARPTTYVSKTELRAVISKATIAYAGTYPVVVFTVAPGAGKSNTFNFTVTPATEEPLPVLSSLSTTTVEAGSPGFVLSVKGSNFAQRSVVRWNNVKRTTTYVSATELRITLSAADLSTAGTRTVAVNTPPPAGGLSKSLTFTIAPKQTACSRDEPNDSTGQAKQLVAGDERLYAICRAGDKDVIKFTAAGNSIYIIEAVNPGTTLDTVIRAYDANGTHIGTFNSNGMGRPEGVRLTTDPGNSSVWYFEFSDYFNGYGNNGSFDYTVRITNATNGLTEDVNGVQSNTEGSSVSSVYRNTK